MKRETAKGWLMRSVFVCFSAEIYNTPCTNLISRELQDGGVGMENLFG